MMYLTSDSPFYHPNKMEKNTPKRKKRIDPSRVCVCVDYTLAATRLCMGPLRPVEMVYNYITLATIWTFSWAHHHMRAGMVWQDQTTSPTTYSLARFTYSSLPSLTAQ